MKALLYPLPGAHSGPNQVSSRKEFSARIVSGFKLTLIFLKSDPSQMFEGVLNTTLTCSIAGNSLKVSKYLNKSIIFDVIIYVNIKILKYAGLHDSIWNSLKQFHCFTYSTETFTDLMFTSILQLKISVPEKSGAPHRFCAPGSLIYSGLFMQIGLEMTRLGLGKSSTFSHCKISERSFFLNMLVKTWSKVVWRY